MKRRTSPIWTTKKEDFQKILDESHSVVEILKKLELNPYSGNHRTVKKRLEVEDFDLSQFKKNQTIDKKKKLKKLISGNKRSNKEVFKENSLYTNRAQIKKRLVSDFNFPYECSECKISNEYNGKPISLQLDHINGISNDNRVENLRFLCPNCHSQTKTFSGKKHKINRSCECGNKILTKQANNCQSCANKTSSKKNFNPTKEELYDLVCIQKIPFTKLGLKFGVSDNAVRKRCKKLKIPYKLKDIKKHNENRTKLKLWNTAKKNSESK